jgi:hypothetical protein
MQEKEMEEEVTGVMIHSAWGTEVLRNDHKCFMTFTLTAYKTFWDGTDS